MQLNDATRTLILDAIRSVFPVLTIAGIVNLSASDTAVVMVMVGYWVSLAAMAFKTGQEPGDPVVIVEK